MIVFDLSCASGHVFEAWFGSSEDFDTQRARGLLSCPMCGASEIGKAVMAPRVGRKGNQQSETLPAISGPEPVAETEKLKAMVEALAQAQREALKNSTWVGARFADEARAIHLGESDLENIHGQATLDEARALIEEGVPVAPLPFPVRPPNADN